MYVSSGAIGLFTVDTLVRVGLYLLRVACGNRRNPLHSHTTTAYSFTQNDNQGTFLAFHFGKCMLSNSYLLHGDNGYF